MGNNQYSVSIENGIISNHELRLINKRLSTIGLTVDWMGAGSRGTDDKIFLMLFLELKEPLGSVCPCTACVNDEGEVFQRENR